MTTLVNGKRGKRLDPSDRGLQFGDGVFETLRLEAGRPVLWERHWARLCRGLEGLGIPQPRQQDCLDDLREVAGSSRALAKLIVTRGSGPRGYAIPERVQPTRIVMGGAALAIPDEGQILRLGICSTRAGRSPLPGCKHLNRLENVLARREWGADWDEGLMLDGFGNVSCATQSNVFILEGGCLLTPSVVDFGVAGTRRDWLLEHASRAGLVVLEAGLSLERVRAAEAIFLSNSRIGLRRALLIGQRDRVAGGGQASAALAMVSELGAELNALA